MLKSLSYIKSEKKYRAFIYLKYFIYLINIIK